MVLKLLVIHTLLIISFIGSRCSYSEADSPTSRTGVRGPRARLWEDHLVYFVFTKSVMKEDRVVIRRIMREIETRTCMRFVEKHQKRSKQLYIKMFKTYNCGICQPFGLMCPLTNAGTVKTTYPLIRRESKGKIEQVKLVFKMPFCGRLTKTLRGLITHELFHVLGVHHTQLRPDRDHFIAVDRSAVRVDKRVQYFPKCETCDTYSLPYECHSVMHYGYSDFARVPWWLSVFRPTMTSRHPSCHLTIDGGTVATKTDWEMVNRVQGCF